MAHSYSSLATYKSCPRKYRYAYIDRLPRGEASPAMQRGTTIHESVEHFLQGKRDDLPPEIAGYVDFFATLRDMEAVPERKWAVGRDWEETSFRDPKAMLRGVMDIELDNAESPVIYELKTGKMYDDHKEQMNLYGLIKLATSELESVRVINVYLDQEDMLEMTFMRAMLDDYKKQWHDKIESAENDKTYPMNPTWKCFYCQYSKSKGGPCNF
jgi:CRISPR/Cas system-associated exonuclease Cas4 (RecB family)